MREKRKVRPKPGVTRLKSMQVQRDLELALTERLAGLTPNGLEARWEAFKGLSKTNMKTSLMRIMQSCCNSFRPELG